jgi:sugar-specific transcriptional regulator TrmB
VILLELVEALMKTGLTRHESVLYVTLCKEGELTGYEAAKISGIPRSNAYLALAGLVEKGGASKIESDPVRYTVVTISEFAANLRRELQQTLDYLEANLPTREMAIDPYITITGRNQIRHKMKNLIGQAGERIYLSLASIELQLLLTELREAVERGLKVVIITDSAFELERATLYYHTKQPGQIRLITDSLHVLTGELTAKPDTACLYSKNQNLVQLIKDSLTNEIELIKLQRSSDSQR